MSFGVLTFLDTKTAILFCLLFRSLIRVYRRFRRTWVSPSSLKAAVSSEVLVHLNIIILACTAQGSAGWLNGSKLLPRCCLSYLEYDEICYRTFLSTVEIRAWNDKFGGCGIYVSKLECNLRAVRKVSSRFEYL